MLTPEHYGESGKGWGAFDDLAWMPDGRSFLLDGISPGLTTQQIWQVSYPGGEARRVTNDLNFLPRRQRLRRWPASGDGSDRDTGEYLDTDGGGWRVASSHVWRARRWHGGADRHAGQPDRVQL